MRIPPYWATGECEGRDRDGRECVFRAWGWSFASPAEAKRDAAARARRIADRLRSDARPDAYDYLERPLREEILGSLKEGDAEVAVITRNRYGAMVLNAAGVCFVDIDFPPARARGFFDAILLAFSAARRRQRQEAVRDETLARVRAWADANPQRSARVYRTRAGLRLLVTDRRYDPASEETAALLAELGSDPLYRRLTEKQQCFRARLTAKPWRCGCEAPPNRYPWQSGEEEAAYRAWEERYGRATAGSAACRLVETVGAGALIPEAAKIVEIHDRYACGAPEAPLA